MSIEATALLSIVATLVGIIGTYSAMKQRAVQDVQEDTAEKSVALYEIRQIADDVREIKRDFKDMRGELQNTRDRIIVVEQSTRSLHKRVDKLEGKQEREEH